MLNSKYLSSLIPKIFKREITTHNLPVKLYEQTAKELMKGVKLAFEFDGSDSALLKELKDNIYVFSSAKTYTQVKDISSLLVQDGKLASFRDFKKAAMEKIQLYNVDYLKAEYDTAVGQAQTAAKWQQIVADAETFPLLQRKAVMDVNTSPECALLNDLVAPVADPLWMTRSPLTHFRCRCIISQIDKYSDTKASSRTKIDRVIKETDHINPIFKGNPGIDKVVFNKDHPYFDIDKKDKAYAKRNFDLKIPK